MESEIKLFIDKLKASDERNTKCVSDHEMNYSDTLPYPSVTYPTTYPTLSLMYRSSTAADKGIVAYHYLYALPIYVPLHIFLNYGTMMNRLTKALEDVHRKMAQQEFRRKRDRLALDCVRLGKIVSVRTVSELGTTT